MNHTIRVAFCGVLAGLSVALLFLTALLPTGSIGFPAVAGLLLVIPVIEIGVRWAFPIYLTAALLALFFVPNKQAAALYVFFFGYYPLLKALVERPRNKALQWVLKLVVFNVAAVSGYLIVVVLNLLPVGSFQLFGISLPWVFWLVGNGVFVLYDIAMTGVILFYIKRLHPTFRKWLRQKK